MIQGNEVISNVEVEAHDKYKAIWKAGKAETLEFLQEDILRKYLAFSADDEVYDQFLGERSRSCNGGPLVLPAGFWVIWLSDFRYAGMT